MAGSAAGGTLTNDRAVDESRYVLAGLLASAHPIGARPASLASATWVAVAASPSWRSYVHAVAPPQGRDLGDVRREVGRLVGRLDEGRAPPIQRGMDKAVAELLGDRTQRSVSGGVRRLVVPSDQPSRSRTGPRPSRRSGALSVSEGGLARRPYSMHASRFGERGGRAGPSRHGPGKPSPGEGGAGSGDRPSPTHDAVASVVKSISGGTRRLTRRRRRGPEAAPPVRPCSDLRQPDGDRPRSSDS